MAVCGDFDAVRRNGVVDELNTDKSAAISPEHTVQSQAYLVVLGGELVKTLLDHVVAIEILDEHDDVQAQCQDDGVNLRRS